MMPCPTHPKERVAGYCTECGSLGCLKCVHEHEGSWYCNKHYEPIAKKLERQERLDASKNRRERQRLVVHTREGKISYGTCVAMNLLSDSFVLDLVDKYGDSLRKSHTTHFNDLKAVFYVKNFSGKGLRDAGIVEHPPGAAPLVVEFHDGEVIQGYTMRRHSGEESRFHLIPRDGHSNNVNILVESAALIGAFSPEEYRQKHRREVEEYIEKHRHPEYPKEELLGDYHFDRRDFSRAIKHYKFALKEEVKAPRIRHKIVSGEYNIGMRHIKYHQYDQALKCMEWVIRADPENEKAKRKAKKLRHHLTHRKSGKEAVVNGRG
jgi:tetratricopeptide (TPR) repeat protein